MERPPKVLYVVGLGRSGSTLLDLVLGEVDGFFSAGELQSMWRESLIDGRLCGCGVEVGECDLWSEILGGRDCRHLGATPVEIAELQSQGLHLPGPGTRGRARWRSDANWHRYVTILERLYLRIGDVTGAKVVVDSSKLPSVASALHRMSPLELSFVQLVRDPRAVAYSWTRRKAASDRTGRGDMERVRATRCALTWSARQLASERVRSAVPGASTLVRYEDFVADPQATAERIVRIAGEPYRPLPLGDDASIHLRPNHTVSGNPLRLQSGQVQVREDDEWRTRLPRAARTAVTTATWPLLARYGYRR